MFNKPNGEKKNIADIPLVDTCVPIPDSYY